MENDVKTRIEACILNSNYPDEFIKMAIKQLYVVNSKAKAFDKIRKIEKICYYTRYDKDRDIDIEGFETFTFTRNTLKTIRNWEGK